MSRTRIADAALLSLAALMGLRSLTLRGLGRVSFIASLLCWPPLARSCVRWNLAAAGATGHCMDEACCTVYTTAAAGRDRLRGRR